MSLAYLTSIVPLLALLVIAAVMDWRSRRIPNWLNLMMALAGLASSIVGVSPVSGWMSLIGLVLGFIIMVGPFAIGAVGGGDVKILAAAGAWLGPIGILIAFACAQIISLICTIFITIRNRRLTELVSNSTSMLVNIAAIRHVGIDHVTEGGKQLKSVGRRLPYAVSLALGVLVTAMFVQ